MKYKELIKKIKNYLGFVGTLSSGDKKNITICAVIDDKKSPIYAEFENLSDPLKEKITKTKLVAIVFILGGAVFLGL